MSMMYHPISGEKIFNEALEDQSAFIEDRLFKPLSWKKFFDKDEDKSVKTYGIEIELNVSSSDPQVRVEVCKKILSVLNKEGRHFHIMRDNSIRNGIELVSAPMTLSYFSNTFDTKEINTLFKELNLIATVDTGLHIHVGERHTRRLRELYIQLFSISYPLWIYLSDRRIYRIQDRYVSTRYFTDKDDLKKRFDATIKSLRHTGISNITYEGVEYFDYHFEDRYSGLNFCNESTIEFRLFSGTNDFNDIKKYLKLVDAIVRLADEISQTRINDVFTLNEFVKRTESQDLLNDTVKYIKFINDRKNRERIYDNEFLLLDTHWYRVPPKSVKRRDFAIDKSVYEEYISRLKELNEHHRYPSSVNLKNDINRLLTHNIFEVVSEPVEVIEMVKVNADTNIVRVDINQTSSNFIFLRGVNSSLLVKDKK